MPRPILRKIIVRILLTIIALCVVVGALGLTKADQIGSLIAFGKQAKQDGPPPETVGSATAKTDQLRQTYDAIGSIASAQGVAVTTEVAGTITALEFDSGDVVKAGDVLVRLDTSVERGQLAQAKARLSLAETALRRTRKLVPSGAESESVLDADSSAYDTAKAEVATLRAQLAKKVIRAPFAGKLGIRMVDTGEYISPGTALTDLEGTDEVFVDFTLPQERLADLQIGMPVEVTVGTEHPRTVLGALRAIDPALQRSTRSLQLRATVPNADASIRPGMFVRVGVVIGEPVESVMVPQTAVVYASYGDSVFVVEPKPADDPGLRETKDGDPVLLARQQFVSLGATQGDFVAVTKGLEDGVQVVVAGAFKLRNGSPVVINNEGVPEPKREPEVANR